MRTNMMLEKMRRGEPVLGCQVRSRSHLIAELLGYSGLDYVFIETEHFVHNIETIENQIRAVQIGGAVPIVRIPSHEDGLILQVLEAGAMGIIFPHIDTKEQAVHAVNEVKFAPVGHRGFGDSARASEFGYIPTEEFLPYVNKNVLAIGMIESQEGIEKDLSLDMGDGGVVTPRVREAVKKICRKVRDSNVMLGDAGLGGLKDEADFKECIELGCRMFTLGSDMALVKKLLTKGLDNFNQLKKSLA